MNSAEKIKKLQINMSQSALDDLSELQKKIHAPTKTQVIKSSLKTFRFLQEKLDEKAEIIIRDKNGKERILHIL